MTNPTRQCYCECLERLIALEAPLRISAKDPTLFTADPEVQQKIAGYLGWTSLCSDPPLAIDEISTLANELRSEGLEAVVLIGQGGSTQASMTITKLHEIESSTSDVAFKTMDSLSPVFVNHILGSSDPARTLYIVSSKSGTTIEPMMLERVVWHYVSAHLGPSAASKRFVVITDNPTGELAQLALAKNYRAILPGEPTVGGRFSALSVFSLFPAALVGIDIATVIEHAAKTEALCKTNVPDNPALELCCFIYAAYSQGRDKICLVMPSSGQVFGLWIEQLVAESLGKDGKGILPNVEVDASILSVPCDDRCIITYEVGATEGFAESLAHFDPSIPTLNLSLNTQSELFARFVVWEFAVAFLGILLKVNPFDQPDVEITKTLVKGLLSGKLADVSQDYIELDFGTSDIVSKLRISRALLEQDGVDARSLITVDGALRTLLGVLKARDYFSLNAFLPFRGYGRREALERMRNRIVSRLGVASCLEIGPRYLHSTGQLHKGGPNNGVFLFISADEENDIAIPDADYTLGELATTQAYADFQALAQRGRRGIHVHLVNNDSETLSRFADRICSAVSAVPKVAYNVITN